MSKKALSCLPPQKPQAATSNRAPSVAIALAPFKASPDSGCRCGSTQTSWQTSVITVAVKSRTSLWRKEGKPPLGQDSTCCMEKDTPGRAHSVETNHISAPEHPKRYPYAVRSPAPLLAGASASLKPLSLGLSPSHAVEERVPALGHQTLYVSPKPSCWQS